MCHRRQKAVFHFPNPNSLLKKVFCISECQAIQRKKKKKRIVGQSFAVHICISLFTDTCLRQVMPFFPSQEDQGVHSSPVCSSSSPLAERINCCQNKRYSLRMCLPESRGASTASAPHAQLFYKADHRMLTNQAKKV